MKKVLILGAKPNGRGLGPHLISGCKSRGINCEFISRWMVDLSKDGWFEKVDFFEVDTIILNAYDYNNHRTQVNAFKRLYAEFKDNPNVQLVVIGSTYHYLEFTPDDTARQYKAAKKELYEFFMNVVLNESYACKMFLFEPGVLGNRSLAVGKTCLPFNQAVAILFNMIDMNLKFFQLSLVGARISPP